MQGTQTLSNQTLGHYQILREAGRGGMSLVYEAEDTRIGRRVALKALSIPMSLSPEMRSAMLTRLNREARAIARLSHPNIVTIYDIGEELGQHFIVMEYLEGLTLRERMDEGSISAAEAAGILDQVAAGLDAVHAAGIVHRDIKPSNVMLLPGGRVKLMDFGVARQSEDTLVTQAGTMVGSPVYMSPEQINGDTPGPSSDLWSLGVVLYEMLAGEPPFSGGNIAQVVYQVTHRSPPPLPRAGRAVQRVLTRALDKDPSQRYGSARELAAAFRAALSLPVVAELSEQPVLSAPGAVASPPPLSRRARPPLLPRPVAWAAALLLLTLLAALPAALRPRRALSPPVQAMLPSSRPKAPVLVAATPRPRPAPVVRIASARQERIARAAKAKPRRFVRLAVYPKHGLQQSERGPRPRNFGRITRKPIPAHKFAPENPIPARKLATLPSEGVGYSGSRNSREAAGIGSLGAGERFARHDKRRRRPVQAWPVREAARPLARLPAAKPVIQTPPETLPSAPVPAPSVSRAESGPNLLGVWHGKHSHNPATLVITHREGNAFAGTMSVRTPEANVRIAVEGHVSPNTGEVSMRERRILWASKPRAWDLGSESGRVAGNGRIAGTGTDVKGRYGAWSFSR